VELAAKDPSDTRTVTGLADSTELIALVHAGLGRRTEALKEIQQAVDSREQIVQRTPESPEDQFELGRTYLHAGRANQLLGHCAEAKTLFDKARPIFQQQNRKLSNKQLEKVSSNLESCR
jgi:tetratricopeptide (TPR) repeat protein